MKAPETLEEARELARAATEDHQNCLANAEGARRLLDSRIAAVHKLVAGHTSMEALALAQYQVNDAHEDWLAAKRAADLFDAAGEVWSSGYQVDGDGNDYAFNICYSPLEYVYRLYRCDERDVICLAVETTLADALAAAEAVLYPREGTARPAPAISLEESTRAGEVVVTFRGTLQSVRTVVDQVLEEANQGSGQHYEIFVERARAALDALPVHLTAADDKAALARYLAYDRF